MRHSSTRIGIALAAAGAILLALLSGALIAPADSLTPGGDWPAYLNGPQHSSYAPGERQITTANVDNLQLRWTFHPNPPSAADQPGPYLFASPAVADGVVYVGSNNGWFYKLSLTTGAVLAKRALGYRPTLTCFQQGVVSSATVAPDPKDGRDTVYVASPDGYLYALRPGDLSTKWRSLVDRPSDTVSDYFNWSSPTVANGHIYLGSASDCDTPLTRGAVVSFDQATGKELGRYFTVPKGKVGGGVWTSVAVATDGSIYSSTGTQVPDSDDLYESVSIVHLDGTTLKRLGTYTIPKAEIGNDSDFGGSPVIFGGLVGACNKNGVFYAIDRKTMQLRWKRVLGSRATAGGIMCAASAAYDGSYLYVAGTPTTIDGKAYRGSIRRLDPATGKVLWARGLPNSVIETPTLDGAGVLTVGTWDKTSTPNAAYLLDARTGRILRTLNTGGRNFAPSVFAGGWLLTTNVTTGMRGYHLPTSP